MNLRFFKSPGNGAPNWLCPGSRLLPSLSLAMFAFLSTVVGAQTISSSPANLVPLWGHLDKVRITIERPTAMIEATPERYPPQTEWFFGGVNSAELLAFLKEAGLRGELLDTNRWRMETNGIRVPVNSGFITGLSPGARQAIYPVLGRFLENAAQNDFYAFPPNELDEWFQRSGLTPNTISWVTNRFYQQGGLTCFSDLGEALLNIQSPAERVRLVKTLSRETTVLLKLRVDESTDIAALLEYWGRRGRTKSVEPLLESLKRVKGGASIDIVHLLPPFARQRLYSYPVTDKSTTNAVQDCYWTAFNFFAETPEFRYGNTEEVKVAVEKSYRRVRDNPRMGDLLLLVNQEGKVVHAANHIADDIVFTKNGEAPTRPWLLMTRDDLLATYTGTAQPRIVAYRLNDAE